MNKHRTAGRMLGCACALLLGACQSAPTRIHTLDSVPGARVESYQAPALRIDSLSVPASWDRIEILSVSAAGTLQISDFDHWAAPLPQIARQALSLDLDQRLPPGTVIYPRLPKPDGAFGINVDILEFGVNGSQASMRAAWTISPTDGLQSAKRSVASLHASLPSTEPAAVAHAWSELIGQLADRIATELASLNMPSTGPASLSR